MSDDDSQQPRRQHSSGKASDLFNLSDPEELLRQSRKKKQAEAAAVKTPAPVASSSISDKTPNPTNIKLTAIHKIVTMADEEAYQQIHTPKINKLQADNYFQWATLMEIQLEDFNFWQYVDIKECIGVSTDETIKKRERRAVMFILQHVHASQWAKINPSERCPHCLWQTIKRAYTL